MQKSENSRQAVSAHRIVKASTTLNRKYVQKPSKSKGDALEVAIKRSSKIKHFDVAPVENFGQINQQEAKLAVASVKTRRKIKVQSEEPIESAIAQAAQSQNQLRNSKIKLFRRPWLTLRGRLTSRMPSRQRSKSEQKCTLAWVEWCWRYPVRQW